ncbi:MAG: ABC transporter ATP-binding protein [Chitinophagaceae bacterium]|jgi:ABC-type multidrug transport system ATPase subunit|nr:ABC transporter ATP-binding protein [Chitinophagaceae bacterium]MCA6467760.1 ABC transporter ATP-binding protein [Chitinophagaceae bacterium]MCA6471359.1 ABC transporter ATP-binding protein [Chitinophagaceae bacterium]MCA6477970.1 ABC transporter ATP-binding protein [Chitinophagaceae bacterium]MCA6479819.1 ABC transporter ATP-binding protein [Chitinophagaceae bacterium]
MELIINNLSKTYANGVKALNNVSLTIPQGMFGLLGPNGAGKSSLMRTIATLQEPDSGSIHLGDIDVLRDQESLRKVLGYLPQEFGVYPRVSAAMMLDHIAQLKGLSNRNQRKETVEALLQKVNLWKERKRNLGSFSGGMKQRFGIAQALVGNPQLLIVDEPTAGLDPAERNRFYNLLSEIGESTIIILSTHIVEDVKTLCKQFAIICGGEVMAVSTPQEAVNWLSNKVWSKSIPKVEIEEYRNNYHVIATQLAEGRLFIRVIADSDPGNGFSPAAPTLEDVYFNAISTKMDLVTL